MAKKLIRVTVNLTPELVERIESYAEKVNVNRTAAVSVLLSNALDQQKAIKDIGSLMDIYNAEKQEAN